MNRKKDFFMIIYFFFVRCSLFEQNSKTLNVSLPEAMTMYLEMAYNDVEQGVLDEEWGNRFFILRNCYIS